MGAGVVARPEGEQDAKVKRVSKAGLDGPDPVEQVAGQDGVDEGVQEVAPEDEVGEWQEAEGAAAPAGHHLSAREEGAGTRAAKRIGTIARRC